MIEVPTGSISGASYPMPPIGGSGSTEPEKSNEEPCEDEEEETE